MNTILITSAVTFVPNNYREVILPLAKNRHIHGIVVLDNRNIELIIKAFLLIFSFAAPRLGIQLLKNYFSPNIKVVSSEYIKNNKKFHLTKDLNAEDTLHFLSNLKIDLLVNARTRVFFKKTLRAIPSLGSINVHHGLLPFQRGLMCDFWALLNGSPKGYSIHKMTGKIDDGEVLCVEVVDDSRDDFLMATYLSSKKEKESLEQILNLVFEKKSLEIDSHVVQHPENAIKYYTNPKIRDFYNLQSKGVKI